MNWPMESNLMNAQSLSHLQKPGHPALKDWLRPLGWGDAQLSFLAGDASFRTYYRLVKGNETRVLMVAPPDFEKPAEYAQITQLLEKHGLSVPEIYHADLKQGFILLEDFGDELYSRCLENGHNEEELYEKAVDVLIHLHQNAADESGLAPYDQEKFFEEAQVFLDWFYPHQVSVELEKSYLTAWSNVYSQLPSMPQAIVLRDYMIDNILYLKDRPGVKACGLLDFQDALRGDVTYDLVSLLEDARRDVSPRLAQKMLERYLEAFPHISKDDLMHSYYAWGAQRSTKIIGVFSRLAKRDNKPHYLKHIPRVWRILRQDLEHPALQSVKQWFDQHQAWGDV